MRVIGKMERGDKVMGKKGRGDMNVEKGNGRIETHLASLKSCLNTHLDKMKKSIYCSQFLINLKPTFLLQAVNYLFQFMPCKVVLLYSGGCGN